MNFAQFKDHLFIRSTPEQYQTLINEQQQLLKRQIESSNSTDEPCKEDLEETVLEIKQVIKLTLKRAQHLEYLVRSFDQIYIPNASQIKLMLFNLCREIRQILETFLSSASFCGDHPKLKSMSEALKQHLRDENQRLAETKLFVKYVSQKSSTIIPMTAFLIERKLASDEMRDDILELQAIFDYLTVQWLTDFSFVLPDLRPELYPYYAQQLIVLSLGLAKEATEEM